MTFLRNNFASDFFLAEAIAYRCDTKSLDDGVGQLDLPFSIVLKRERGN